MPHTTMHPQLHHPRAARSTLLASGLALSISAITLLSSTSSVRADDPGLLDSQPAPAEKDSSVAVVLTSAPRSIDITGRDFAGVRFPGQPSQGPVILKAHRAYVWKDVGSGADTENFGIGSSEVCDRMLLSGDVTVEMGDYRFSAARASIWIQRLPASDPAAASTNKHLFQAAVCFDRVSDPGAQAGFAQAADRLLVTGVFDCILSLKADAVESERPSSDPQLNAFTIESECRLAAHLRRQLGLPADLNESDFAAPLPDDSITPGVSRPYEPNSPLTRRRRSSTPIAAPRPAAPVSESLFASDGYITFAVGTNRAPSPDGQTTPIGQEEIKLIRGSDGQDNTLILSSGVVVQYQDIRQNRNLQISAQRAVIFLKPGPLTELTRFSIKDVHGIYIEGDVVATDGQYTLRGPRLYYDIQNNQALMVDAVFFTFDPNLQLPIYVRADELRQRAANQFSADGHVRIAATSFFDPVLSVGASSVTVSQQPSTDQPGQTATYVNAKNLTLRFADFPFFWIPGYKGQVQDIPLKDLRIENSSGSGTALKTGWDIFSLANLDHPQGVESRLLLDWFFDRGPAVGNRSDWTTESHDGDLLAYLLPDDDGEDVLTSGARRGRDSQTRGTIIAHDRWTLSPRWSLFLEGHYISDENFIDAFFRPIAQNERELANSAYLRYLHANNAFTFQAKGSINDFTPNQYLLSSLGYTVDKLPEAAYFSVADDVFSRTAPGLLTWTHEYRASRVAFNFVEPTASELGFNSMARARAALGLLPNQSPADALRAAGLSEEDVLRFDTRQEFASTQDFTFFKFTPFVVGRLTAYDSDFKDFNSGSGDKNRYFYSIGSRFSTQIARVYNDAHSELFDIHRLRHIIEPNFTIWHAGSNVSQNDLPLYDERVESLATGATIRAGVTQTLQTQRGGPGRWYNVNLLTLTTEIVSSTDDADKEGPVGHFIDYRPEYSYLGDFLNFDSTWQVTDAVALSGNYVYDLDINQPARSSAGGTIQHSPDFSSFAEVRYLNALDSTFVDAGVAYDLTRRYSLTASGTYDTDLNELQSVGGSLRRKMREATLGFSIRYDNIRSETSFSFVIEPQLVRSQASAQSERLRNLSR